MEDLWVLLFEEKVCIKGSSYCLDEMPPVKLRKQRRKQLIVLLNKLQVSFFLLLGSILNWCVEHGEKLKRQAIETGEKLKSAAKDAKKQVEKRSEGLGDKLFNILFDVKNSIFGTRSSFL